jgi:hypothetical protein
MKKILLATICAATFIACEKKDDNINSNNNNNQTASVVGDWQLIKSVVYYTPLNSSNELSKDVTVEEGTNFYKFKTDNTLIVSETINGTPEDNYTYTLSGTDLILTQPSSNEIFNMKILVLNQTDLQWQHNNSAGTYLFGSNNDTLGITTKVIVDFKRQ